MAPEPIEEESGTVDPRARLAEALNDAADLCGGATDGGDDMDAIEEAKATPEAQVYVATEGTLRVRDDDTVVERPADA